jgi:hypothetical protein
MAQQKSESSAPASGKPSTSTKPAQAVSSSGPQSSGRPLVSQSTKQQQQQPLAQPLTQKPSATPSTLAANNNNTPPAKKISSSVTSSVPAPSPSSTTATSERAQARHQLETAAADRLIHHRLQEKEAFRSFSEQINSRLPKLASPKQSLNELGAASDKPDTVTTKNPETTKPLNQENKAFSSATPPSASKQTPSSQPPKQQQKPAPATPPPQADKKKPAPSQPQQPPKVPVPQKENFPDTVSEADSVATTATTATTKSRFRLNVGAAEFTPTFTPEGGRPQSAFGYNKRGHKGPGSGGYKKNYSKQYQPRPNYCMCLFKV